MKKYAVFTKTEFVPTHELSLSNKIVEKEDFGTILQIINQWAKSIYQDAAVYPKDIENKIDSLSIMRIHTVGDNTGLVIYRKESNIRFRLGFFRTTYETREVM